MPLPGPPSSQRRDAFQGKDLTRRERGVHLWEPGQLLERSPAGHKTPPFPLTSACLPPPISPSQTVLSPFLAFLTPSKAHRMPPNSFTLEVASFPSQPRLPRPQSLGGSSPLPRPTVRLSPGGGKLRQTFHWGAGAPGLRAQSRSSRARFSQRGLLRSQPHCDQWGLLSGKPWFERLQPPFLSLASEPGKRLLPSLPKTSPKLVRKGAQSFPRLQVCLSF